LNKRFNEALHAADDLRTKKLVVEFLTKGFGWKLDTPLEQQPEAYKDWDFQILDQDGNLRAVEVEYVHTWLDRGRRPPRWPNMSVPYRKAQSKAQVMVRVNHYGDTVCYTAMRNVLASPVETKRTLNSRSGETTVNEPFFSVPHSKWSFASKFGNEGRWQRVTESGDPIERS